MSELVDSPFLVPFSGGFRVADAATGMPRDKRDNGEAKKQLEQEVEKIDKLQRRIFADGRYPVLLIFQAMDAGGKDSTIRAVLTGVNPAGCRVHAFGRPSSEELSHDFLWRCARRLPDRGRIGVFNRSYYEDVLSVRVHPRWLKAQHLPHLPDDLDVLWQQRYAAIRDFESHLAASGTIILKFWLNVSLAEQKKRLLDRLDEPDKNWKFDAGDLDDRERWSDYMRAYEDALNATSRAHAPWYAIPADHKPSMRVAVAEIIARRLAMLDLRYPQPVSAQVLDALRERLKKEEPPRRN